MNSTTPNSTSMFPPANLPIGNVTINASGQGDQEAQDERPPEADAVNGVDVVLPIIPAPQDPTPTPPAQHDLDTVVLPQAHTARLDLSEPITEAPSNPTP